LSKPKAKYNVSLLLVTDNRKTAIAVDTIIHQTTLRQKKADYALGALGTTCIGAEKAGVLVFM
jgi:hypothetical protein